MSLRTLKYRFIHGFLLKPAIWLLKGWMATLRFDKGELGQALMVTRSPRAVLATLHGEVIPMIALTRYAAREHRQLAVLTSPSRDGMLIDTIISAFGVRPVKGSSSKRAAAGLLAFVRAIEEGCIGLLAVDGPRGPRAVPKPGFHAAATMASASLFVLNCGCRHAFTFNSWDRFFLPLPFSRIHLSIVPVEGIASMEEQTAIAHVQKVIIENGRAVHSIVVEGLE